ncbi:MAG TPA: glycosyltransferase family 39 protein [Solirubrobacteraceae bacterium]|nr:glycosyltransferase family 39 protein [Solirubrobacteraceae bacterium]
MESTALASVTPHHPPATARRAVPRPNPAVVITALAAAAPIVIYLWIALHRVGYPFELDWMEGGSVELAGRVLGGHSLYSAPSITFVGWTYPPLYYWLAAGVAKLTGLGFLPLRLVSLAASLAAMGILGWMVVKETGNRTAAVVAAGLFAATFHITGAWFDTGRVDSLFLALTLGAIAYGRWARTPRAGIGLGVLAFLAFFTKQTALLALAPVLLYLVLTRRRVGIPAALTLTALIVASTLILNATTGGWYGYYIYAELLHQQVAHTLWLGFWRDDILHQQWPLLILIAAGGLALAKHKADRRTNRRAAVYYLIAAAGLLGSAWASRVHTGGYLNVLMPAYAALALLAGLTYGALNETKRKTIAAPATAAAVLVQLALLIYPINAQLPTAADRTAGAQLIARLRNLPGRVIVLRHPWYATEAGKGTFAQEEALGDVLRSTDAKGARPLSASLKHALRTDHVQAVVLDGTFDAHFLEPELSRDFRLVPEPITPRRLYPLTDVRTSPTLLYLRKNPSPRR